MFEAINLKKIVEPTTSNGTELAFPFRGLNSISAFVSSGAH